MFCDIFSRQINYEWILILLLSLLPCKCIPIVTPDHRSHYLSKLFIHNTSSLYNPRMIFQKKRSNPIVFPTRESIKMGYPRVPQLQKNEDETSESIKTRYLRVPQLNENGDPNCLLNDGDTYCESVEDYPMKYIREQLVKRIDEYRDLFGFKGIDSRKSYSDEDLSDERVCRAIRKTIFPKIALTESKRWVYVVNDEKDFRQSVIAETCEKPEKSCNYIEDGVPTAHHSKCKQKYASVKLLAIHPTNNKTYTDTFIFPTCCVCVVKTSFSFRKN